jgi:hypothetical protein
MAGEIQRIIDGVPEGTYDAILLGYGLCGNGLEGVCARHTPLVIPRAHDCIALLMGSRFRYEQYFELNPGTYYRSTGWIERGQGLQQLAHTATGFEETLEALIERYGDDDGHYLYDQFTSYRLAYRKLAYIETGLEPDSRFESGARKEAADRGWRFEKVRGDLKLMSELVSGNWPNKDFQVIQPGECIVPSYRPDVVRIRKMVQE